MSESLRWVRRQLQQSLWTSLVVTSVIGWLGAFTYLTLTTGLTPMAAMPWSLAVGQVAAGTRLAVAVATNPLHYRFLRSYTSTVYNLEPIVLRTLRFDDDLDEARVDDDRRAQIGAVLGRWKLTRTVAVEDPDVAVSPRFDLYHSASGMVLAAVGDPSGSFALMSCLDDGRILHTTDLLLPPHPALVVNTVRGGPADVARAHTRLLGLLGTIGIGPRPTDIGVLQQVLDAERNAYADLGSALGSLLDLEHNRSPNLSFGVDSDALLERTLIG